jgi:drug/metabolite transporter (DMT)-like permease
LVFEEGPAAFAGPPCGRAGFLHLSGVLKGRGGLLPPPPELQMHLFKAISLKLISLLLFAFMSVLVRSVGDSVPVGQAVFFRSAFAIVPVVLIYTWRGEMRAAMKTSRPLGHLGRGSLGIAGMFANFSALFRLPLVEATAISFLSPLITVALSALILKERVRVYRWSAVAVGFVGVMVMLVPHLDPSRYAAGAATTATIIGACCALFSAFSNAGTVIQTRRLTFTESTPSIVFYFSLTCTVGGLLTLPFGWVMPAPPVLAALVSVGLLGGLSHIVLTESYRFASASVLAPFDYSAMLWAFILGWFFFSELPDMYVYIGSVIVAAAGLFIIWRERQLGLKHDKFDEGPPVVT